MPTHSSKSSSGSSKLMDVAEFLRKHGDQLQNVRDLDTDKIIHETQEAARLKLVSDMGQTAAVVQSANDPKLKFAGDSAEDFETVGAFVNYLHMSYEAFQGVREQTMHDARAQAVQFAEATTADRKDPMAALTQASWQLLNLFTNEVGFDAGTGRAVKLLDPDCPGMSRESLKRWADSQYGPICGYTAGHIMVTQSVSELWWQGMTRDIARIFRKRVFDPTNDRDDFHSDVYNTWHMMRRRMPKPDMSATFDDVKIFYDHLMYLSGGDRQTVEYVLDYLATVYQKPDEKIPVTLAFVSPRRGTGKSMVGVAVKWVWGGEGMVREAGGSALWDAFDCDFIDCVFTIIEELPRRTKVNSVDDLGKFNKLTSAVRTSLKAKHIPARSHRTPHLIITTNEMDSLPLASDDRRLCPLLCLDAPKDQDYYDRIGAWIGKLAPGYGIPKLAGYLAKRDISGFRIDQRPPMTRAKQRLTDENLSERATWLRSKIEAGMPPFDKDLGRSREVLDALKGYKDDPEYARLYFTEKNFLPALRELREGSVYMGRVDETATSPKYMQVCWRHMVLWRSCTANARFEHELTGARPFEVPLPHDEDHDYVQ